MADFTANARKIMDGISSERISGESTPVVVAQLLEAQVYATLALVDAINRASAENIKAILSDGVS